MTCPYPDGTNCSGVGPSVILAILVHAIVGFEGTDDKMIFLGVLFYPIYVRL